jgi:hypothetical protein
MQDAIGWTAAERDWSAMAPLFDSSVAGDLAVFSQSLVDIGIY